MADTTLDTSSTDATTTTSTTATPADSSTTTTSVGATAAPPAKPTGYTYQEDRSRWIPPHRLNEASQKAQRLEAELTAERARVAALAGVQPSDPNSQKTEEIKAAFLKMFPQFGELANLSVEQIKALVQTPEKADRAVEIEKREWARHGKAQLTALYSQVADVLGTDALSADQKDDLRESFSAWFQRTVKRELAESGGEESKTLTRYEDSDPSLVKDFTDRYTEQWLKPAQRRATQQIIPRTRPVPNSQGRAQVTGTKRPDKFDSMDDRLDYALKLGRERGLVIGKE